MASARISVLPLGAQVTLFSVEATEFPEWVTGDEAAIANSSALVVATRSDVDGEVKMQVSLGNVEDGPGIPVFEGDLTLQSGEVEFGSVLSGELHRTRIGGRGVYHAVVAVDTPNSVSEVFVSLAPKE